jgi:hypothetical protein
MSFTLVQSGTTLYAVNTDGGFVALTLPSGITLSSQLVPRFARFKRYAILVNTPTRPILIAPDGTTYPLTLVPPPNALVLSNTNGGTLSGTYRAFYTFRILDTNGNVVTESALSDESNEFTVTTDFLNASSVAISTESITDRQLYRNATSGTEFFPWITLDGNVNTSLNDDTPDASLGTIALDVDTLGSAPDLTLIAEFGGRVWGVDRTDKDNLRWTEAGKAYAWGALNTLPIPHVGQDDYGIMALAARRNALGVFRVNGLYAVTGSTLANIKPTTIKEGLGTTSQETVWIYNDAVYFLARTGVYRWDDNGVVCVSDTGNVRSWFTGDKTFNRAMFYRSFAVLDEKRGFYHLFLASTGQFTIDRWVTLDLNTGRWFGPHKTDAFVPTSAFLVRGSDGFPYSMVGSSQGIISVESEAKNDWDAVSIDMKTLGREHDGGLPNVEKVFLRPSILGDAAPGICKVVPYVGDPDNIARTPAMDWHMSLGRERLSPCGFGTRCQIAFEHNVINEDVKIHGYEIPWVIRGTR